MVSLWRIVFVAFGVFFLTVAFATAAPNTNIVFKNCNSDTYGEGGYANSVDYVLEAMVTVTANHPGYDYHTNSPYPTEVAYGHSTCSTALTFTDCVTCVSAAKNYIKQMCPYSMGAEMDLQDCSMRYEKYFV